MNYYGPKKLSPNTTRNFTVEVEGSVDKASLVDPRFWRNVQQSLSVDDLVEVRTKDGSADALIRVVENGKSGVIVCVLRAYFNTFDDLAEGLEVKWTGPNTKWAILLGGERMTDNITDKAVAYTMARELMQPSEGAVN